MQISCPKCAKAFDVKDDLIPKEGRLVQCGNCENKWFFKKQIILTSNNTESKIKEKKQIKIKEKILDSKPDFKEKKTQIKTRKYEELNQNLYNKKNINFFKLLIVSAISIIAFVILIDTFKNQISLFYPEINELLQNLFESLRDISLFLKDLIN